MLSKFIDIERNLPGSKKPYTKKEKILEELGEAKKFDLDRSKAFLKEAGLTESQLEKIANLNDTRAFEIAENFARKSDVFNSKIDELLESTSQTMKNEEVLIWNKEYGIDIDLFDKLKKVSASPHLKNPEKVVEWFNKNINKRLDNPGYIEQLNEATKMIDKKLDVIFEEGGDIVDLSNRRAYQIKAIHASKRDMESFKNNLKSASNQFVTESTPNGYRRFIKIKFVNPESELYYKSLREFRNELQKYYNAIKNNDVVGSNLRAVDEIQIENTIGKFRYEIKEDVVFILN